MKKYFLRTTSILALALCFIVPAKQGSAKRNKVLTGDGFLTLKNVHLNESISVQYRNNDGSYNKIALAFVNEVLRCRKTQQEHKITPDLLEVVDHIQDHFGVEEIEVISGYRSPAFNENLYSTGHKVAKNSLHTHGLAMDIRIPGVKTKVLRDFAASLKAGGVGYYPDNAFVHVDTGRVRYW